MSVVSGTEAYSKFFLIVDSVDAYASFGAVLICSSENLYDFFPRSLDLLTSTGTNTHSVTSSNTRIPAGTAPEITGINKDPSSISAVVIVSPLVEEMVVGTSLVLVVEVVSSPVVLVLAEVRISVLIITG